ncbi:MAG: GAF domain-containing protein, partial [Stellaceae bacterium]
THAQWSAGTVDQRRYDFVRLLRQVPAITELVQIDGAGKEQLKVSRLAMDVVGSGTDLSADPRFARAVADKVWFSPVYFRKESEPYMTISVSHVGRNAGVTVAEVNLKFIWDVVTSIKIGQAGYAYVVNGQGRLIAHPDISLVLRDTDLSRLSQVAGALTALRNHEPPTSTAATATGPDGASVLTAYAAIPRLDWLVFVELPQREAMAPVYASLTQTGALLGLGLLLAAVAGALLARRMAVPIRRLQAGAERLGSGELDHRIEIRTGDEIEVLADRFNRMGAQLQESYATLEAKVETRTHELAEALEYQTATSEVLRIVASSPDHLQPVFDAMLGKATELCGAKFGLLLLYDGETYKTVAVKNLPSPVAAAFGGDGLRPGPNTTLGRIARTKQLCQISDVRDDIAYIERDPARVALVELGGARGHLAVPLLKKGELIGAFAIYRQEPGAFAESQMALVKTFADQAVIAIENARLISETREALEQQTATAEVLQVINASPGDLAPVFDAMLDKALRLCEAAFGFLARYDGNRFEHAAQRGVPDALVEYFRTGMDQPHPGDAHWRLLAGEELIHNLDLMDDDAYRQGSPLRLAVVDLGGARSALVVALRKEGALLGTITIYRKEVRPFSDKQVALLQNFAAQAVIAIENARLLTETREALEQQTATADVLKVISGSPGELKPVFDTMLENALRLCEAKFGVMQFYEDGGFRIGAIHNAPPAFAEAMARREALMRPTPQHPFMRMVTTKAVVQIADLMESPAYKERDYGIVMLVERASARTFLAVPMVKENEVAGVIAIYRQEVRPFTDKQVAVVVNFANQAVIAIENARLLGELRERSADLARSVEELTATSDVLKIISRSSVELQTVLDTLVERAARLCRAEQAYMFRRRGDRYYMLASLGASDKFKEYTLQNPFEAGRGTVTGRAVLEGRTVHIADVLADPEYTYQEGRGLAGFRTNLAVPLVREDTLLGVFTLVRTHVDPFTDKEIELVTTFADQAVIAIENARLFDELRDRSGELARSVEELTTLREVGQAVSSTLDLGTVLETIVKRAVALAGAETGAIYRYRKADREFRLGTSHGLDEQLAAKVRGAPIREEETTALRRTIAERAPVQIDLEAAPHLPLRDLMVAAGFRTVLMVPLIGADRVFGVLSIQKKAVGEFPESTVKLMQTFATQSVLAIQNARLFREVEEQGHALAEASRHKSQFLANMSHELRTPLNAVLGYAELLADGIYGELGEKAKGVLERIQSNGKHLLGLINDVLDLSKIEAGQLSLTIEDYAMPAVVHSVVSATESLAKNKGLSLVSSVPRVLPMGRGDERRLTQ